jgi:DNA-binding NtrC family response regulator
MEAPAVNPMTETILVVDDDQDMCWVLQAVLVRLGYRATTVGLARHAMTAMADQAFPIAFVDARLPDMDGLRLIEELRRLQPVMRIIMISGYFLEDDACILDAVRARAIDGFLAKPFRIEAIVAAVNGIAPSWSLDSLAAIARGDLAPVHPGATARVQAPRTALVGGAKA